MDQTDHKFLFDLYKEMLALERTKSAIFSNLWTILVTSLALLSSIYFSSQENENIHFIPLMIPFLIAIWAGFAFFNYLYLVVLRKYIIAIEIKIQDSMIPGETARLWFKDIFPYSIKYAANILVYVAAVLFVGVLALVIILFVGVLPRLPSWFTATYLVFAVGSWVAVVVYAKALQNRIFEKVPWLKQLDLIQKNEAVK